MRIVNMRKWSGSRDGAGNRTYKITFLVEGALGEGPAAALSTPGLPVYGTRWAIDSDEDVWAYCRCDASATPVVTNEPNTRFEVELTFSSKPVESKVCYECIREDPLLEPPKLSVSFKSSKEEATVDRFGMPIVNSAHEQMRGPQVEFDVGSMTVKVEQNVPLHQTGLLAVYYNTVNAYPLWGLPPRTIRFSGASWDRQYTGACEVYYKRTIEYEVKFDGWDRVLLDEGTKVLHGKWDAASGAWIVGYIGGRLADRTNPEHFDRFKDRQGENCKVILNGFGLPAGIIVGTTDVYVSLDDTNVSQSLYDTDWWLPVYGGTDEILPWDSGTEYRAGNVVQIASTVFLCTDGALGEVDMPGASSKWLELGAVGSEPLLRGDYDPATTYAKGDAVREVSTTKTSAGSIRVERYPDADFLALGVPVDF